MRDTSSWQQRIGNQRDWVWRGWQTRYVYMRSSQINNISSSPLILLHGFGASIEHWRNNIPVLAQKRTVYALDLLGFGASRKAAINYSIPLWVEQVHDFWQTFIDEPIILVGNSIGSLVCLVAAATYPEMVKGIVMLSLPDVALRQQAIPKPLQPIVNTIEGMVGSPGVLTLLFRFLRRPQILSRWAAIAYHSSEAINEELISILGAPAQDEGAEQTFYSLFTSVRQVEFAPGATTILPQLNLPMLLVWGKQDRMVPPILAREFAKLNPQIELIEMDNAGHCPHDECPERFNTILLSWLEKNF